MLRYFNSSLFSITLAALGLLLVPGQTAHAQITLTLDTATLTGPPGTVLTYTGVLQNTSGTEVFLNGTAHDPLPAGFTFDDTPFFLNAPMSLLPNAFSADIALFTIALDAGLPEGASASSVFRLIGGADSLAQNEVGNSAFTAQALIPITNTPEPSSFALLVGMGTFSLLFARQRRPK